MGKRNRTKRDNKAVMIKSDKATQQDIKACSENNDIVTANVSSAGREAVVHNNTFESTESVATVSCKEGIEDSQSKYREHWNELRAILDALESLEKENQHLRQENTSLNRLSKNPCRDCLTRLVMVAVCTFFLLGILDDEHVCPNKKDPFSRIAGSFVREYLLGHTPRPFVMQ